MKVGGTGVEMGDGVAIAAAVTVGGTGGGELAGIEAAKTGLAVAVDGAVVEAGAEVGARS